MKKAKDLIRIYTGPEVSAILLKSRLEETGVYTLTKNDYTGAFMAAYPPSVDLWINEDDLEKARPVIDDFMSAIGTEEP